MADLKETAVWEAVRQLETSDPVMGGENGISNTAPRQLANRTLWLKNELANSIASINTGKANKATTLEGYGIANAYTKTETDNLLKNKANTSNTLAGYGITDALTVNTSQSISGIKTFSDTTGFLSAKSVGYGAWQDTVRLNGALPTVSNGSMGIGFHTADRNMYIIDITGQSYLATFNFAAKSVSVSGSINATNGFNKSGVETAYQNVNFIAGDGLTGGGTLAANRSFAIDKAAASDLTAGTLNKVVTADVLKAELDKKSNLGVGQTYNNVKTSRTTNIDYVNNSDKPILVLISVICSSQNQQVKFLIDGIEIQTLAVSESGREWPTIRPGFSVIVPVGATYKVTGLNTNIMNWTELR